MKFILESIKPYIPKILFGTLLSSGSGLCVLVLIRIINSHLQNKMTQFNIFDFSSKFVVLLIGFIILAVFATSVLAKISNQIILDLRLRVSRIVLNSSFQQLEFKKQSIMVVMVQDIKTIAGVFNRIPGTISRLVIGIGGITYLFIISWKLCLVILGLFAVVSVITYFTNKRLNVIAELSRKSQGKVYRGFAEMVYGIKELYSNPLHKSYYLNKYLPEVFQEEYTQTVREKKNGEITGKANEAVMLLGIGVLIILINVYEVVETGTFVEFLTVSLFIIGPLSSLASFTKSFSPFRAALKEISELGLKINQVTSDQEVLAPDTLKQNIHYEGISFKYYNQDIDDYFQLGPLDLEIVRGKITMIIGGNGSGKTTLAKVICGLYLPQNGVVKIGHTEINTSNQDSFRELFSPIFTDNHLFKDLGYIDPWDETTANALLDKLILSHKVGFKDQKITADLSIGQQKRLAMIKAIIENNEIFLFDEWAANQDPRFKKVFYEEIIPELIEQQKTVIIISHDDAYFDQADYLVRLRDGQLVKQ